jgi:mannose-6-phosphate isomerase-like protein (cupin superfamily)
MADYRSDRIINGVTHDERAAFPPLRVVNLKTESGKVEQIYKNFVVLGVNDHCLRLAVMQGGSRWHQHPRSDELFLVLEGELELDLADGRTLCVKPGDAVTVPAGVVHRSRSRGRAVNLCFETREAYTDVVFEDKDAE